MTTRTKTTSPRSTSIEFRRTTPTRRPNHKPSQTETKVFADDPFRARFKHQLPRGLREEAHGMEWRTFTQTYAPVATIRLTGIEETRQRGGISQFSATIINDATTPRTSHHTEITATGPISACTNLLADLGYRVEILEFHQFEVFQSTVTFIYAGNNHHRTWAMGFGGTPGQSIAATLSSAAHLLHSEKIVEKPWTL